jgi:hypothetical protein
MVAAELGMEVDVGRPQRAAGEAQATEVAVELEAGAAEVLPVAGAVPVGRELGRVAAALRLGAGQTAAAARRTPAVEAGPERHVPAATLSGA